MPSPFSTRPTSALLWLALALGATGMPLRAEITLAAPVEDIRSRLRDGKIEAAIQAGEAAVERLADDTQAWLWLGRAYGRQALAASLLAKPNWAGRTRDAFEKAVALDAGNLDARLDLMQFYVMAPGFMGGGRDKADAQARELRQRDAVMGKLADAMLADADEQPAQAEQALREAVGLDPDSARARVSLSGRMQREQRWQEARDLWQQRLDRIAGDPLAAYQLGRLAALSGEQLDEGLAHLATYAASGAESEYMTRAGAHWRRGQILEKLGRRDEALQAYGEAVRLQPSLEGAVADLARLRDA
jgi:cytochrome c-type biogenesis protein CcmH/NrfG